MRLSRSLLDLRPRYVSPDARPRLDDMTWRSQEEKLGKQEVTEINKDMTLGPMDTIKKKMGW